MKEMYAAVVYANTAGTGFTKDLFLYFRIVCENVQRKSFWLAVHNLDRFSNSL